MLKRQTYRRMIKMDYEALYDKLYRYCYFKLHHQQDAEDITQEVLLRSFSLENNKRIKDPIRYLYTMARNLCTDRLRKTHEEELPDQLSSSDFIETVDTRILLETAIRKLTEDEQQLIFLRYINELPIRYISNITGQSRYVIYRKLNKILEKLKSELKRGEE